MPTAADTFKALQGPLLWKKPGRGFLNLQVWLCRALIETMAPRIDMEFVSIGLSRPVSGHLLDLREPAGHS